MKSLGFSVLRMDQMTLGWDVRTTGEEDGFHYGFNVESMGSMVIANVVCNAEGGIFEGDAEGWYEVGEKLKVDYNYEHLKYVMKRSEATRPLEHPRRGNPPHGIFELVSASRFKICRRCGAPPGTCDSRRADRKWVVARDNTPCGDDQIRSERQKRRAKRRAKRGTKRLVYCCLVAPLSSWRSSSLAQALSVRLLKANSH